MVVIAQLEADVVAGVLITAVAPKFIENEAMFVVMVRTSALQESVIITLNWLVNAAPTASVDAVAVMISLTNQVPTYAVLSAYDRPDASAMTRLPPLV